MELLLEQRRRRKRRKGRRKKAAVVAAEDARSIDDLSDDLLWRILLGLDSPLWLIRASCACRRWRRVVTGEGDDADHGRAFLRLASSLHPPTIVGQYHNLRGRGHRFVPSSSPPPPSPVPVIIDGGSRSRFVDDLLLQNSRWRWHVVDCHGGLVLLRMLFGSGSAPSHIVYDPLTRRHHVIYSSPLPKGFFDAKDTLMLLLDGDDGDISVSNFRVMYRFGAGGPGGLQTCVFSTAANGGGEDWRLLSRRQPAAASAATGCGLGQLAGRVDGCVYLGMQTMGMGSVVVVALDNASLLFSKVELPIRTRAAAVNTSSGSLSRPSSTFTVVHGGTTGAAGRPTSPAARAKTTTSIVHVCGTELELFRRVHGSGGEWVLEHSIPNLSEAATRGRRRLSICPEHDIDMQWMTMVDAVAADDGAGLAILSVCPLDSCCPCTCRRFLSFDVNTMELRVLPHQELYRDAIKIFNYTLPWPKFLRTCPP